MTLQLPPTSVQNWVADSSASHHTTPLAGNISKLCPLNSSDPSSIVVGNGSSLPITSVGDSVLLDPFYLIIILLAPIIVQNLLSVHHFTTDNWCSVKDLTIRNVIVRSNSIDPLYTMRLLESVTPFGAVIALVATPTPLLLLLRLPDIVILVIRALTPYLTCLGLLLLIVPAIKMIFIMPAS
jgi:hypothetical protein